MAGNPVKPAVKYTIFETKWGFFGLAATDSGLCRTSLPHPDKERVKAGLLKRLGDAEFQKNLFKPLQQQIKTYYKATYVDFDSSIPLDLSSLTPFARTVLKACRKIKPGRTLTYRQLAKAAHRPNAARAAGSIMAKNPMPLIIPCHRIIRSDGKIGNFSAPGGPPLKKRMLDHERHIAYSR
jgi:methylated-DNA-[protein]-cysteine S-methyltransferase